MSISASLRNAAQLSVNIQAGSAGGFAGEEYAGPYAVTPDISAQTLATAQKFMRQDVSIHAIPYYDVGNSAGGRTIYIGKELE